MSKRTFHSRHSSPVGRLTDREWAELSFHEKMEDDPRRFLEDNLDRYKACIIDKIHFPGRVEATAARMKLFELTVFCPVSEQGDRLVVFGCTPTAVEEAAKRIIAREPINGGFYCDRSDECPPSTAEYWKTTLQPLKELAAMGIPGLWPDVSGVWEIECPEMSEEWRKISPFKTKRQLVLYRVHHGQSDERFGFFDFGIITGIMRFERPDNRFKGTERSDASTEREKSAKTRPALKGDAYQQGYAEGYLKGLKDGEKKGRDSMRKEYESDVEDDLNYEAPPLVDPSNIFELHKDANLVCPARSTWRYRWRGKKGWCGEVQVGSDEMSSTIEFCEPMGMRLRGTFKCDLLPECTFTGKRVGPNRLGRLPQIKREWDAMGEAAASMVETEKSGTSARRQRMAMCSNDSSEEFRGPSKRRRRE